MIHWRLSAYLQGGTCTISYIQDDRMGSIEVDVGHCGRLVSGPQRVGEAVSSQRESSIGGKLSQAKESGTRRDEGGQL